MLYLATEGSIDKELVDPLLAEENASSTLQPYLVGNSSAILGPTRTNELGIVSPRIRTALIKFIKAVSKRYQSRSDAGFAIIRVGPNEHAATLSPLQRCAPSDSLAACFLPLCWVNILHQATVGF